jgi:hypothetical protein
MKEFEFLYNKYEIKNSQIQAKSPKTWLKTVFYSFWGGNNIQPIYSCHKNNLIPWNCNKLLKFHIFNFSFKQGCSYLIMQILFGRLGAESEKIILLKFSLDIDQVWGRFFF